MCLMFCTMFCFESGTLGLLISYYNFFLYFGETFKIIMLFGIELILPLDHYSTLVCFKTA